MLVETDPCPSLYSILFEFQKQLMGQRSYSMHSKYGKYGCIMQFSHVTLTKQMVPCCHITINVTFFINYLYSLQCQYVQSCHMTEVLHNHNFHIWSAYYIWSHTIFGAILYLEVHTIFGSVSMFHLCNQL